MLYLFALSFYAIRAQGDPKLRKIPIVFNLELDILKVVTPIYPAAHSVLKWNGVNAGRITIVHDPILSIKTVWAENSRRPITDISGKFENMSSCFLIATGFF